MRVLQKISIVFVLSALLAAEAQESPALEPAPPSASLDQPMIELPVPPGCSDPEFGLVAQSRAISRYDAISPCDALELGAPDDKFLIMRLEENPHDIGSIEVWRPVQPSFRSELLEEGLESACAAMFDVATNGRAFNIAVACDVAGFERDVRRAVAESLYAPQRKAGVLIPTLRVLQPVRFCLED